MKNNIIYIITYVIIHISSLSFAQTELIISNSSQIKQSGGFIVLRNTSLKNNSTFHSGSGTVIMTGNVDSTKSEISGSSSTTFFNLMINKSKNNAILRQNITISNNLNLSSGKLTLSNHDLTMGNAAQFTNINKDRYVKTNGTGSLVRQVGNTWTAFPIGNATFNPARLKNDGTIDNFSIKVKDHFLQNGTTGNAITANVIPKTWLIEEETVGGSDVSMRLVWRPLHAGGGFNTNASQITHYTGGSWQDQASGTSTADNSYSSDHRYREAINITSFSPFGVKSGAALPVELLYFYAEKEGENVRLDWQTATELNNSHFEVEWSKDGVNFEKIGKITGAGTTTEVQFYDFLHINPINGENYYRLRQVDFDGKFEYTNIIQIEFQQSNISTIEIYPNPASHYLKVESEQSIGEMIQLFNVNGQLVQEFTHQSLITNLSITDLPSGTYFIKIGTQVKKIIIQK